MVNKEVAVHKTFVDEQMSAIAKQLAVIRRDIDGHIHTIDETVDTTTLNSRVDLLGQQIDYLANLIRSGSQAVGLHAITHSLAGIDELDHGIMSGLADDDHPHYSLVDGTRAFTGTIILEETITPSGVPSYGKIYVKSADSLLYFMDDSGSEYTINVTPV